MKVELTKEGWLNLVPETQEEFDILKYMTDNNGVFRSNGTVYHSKLPVMVGNSKFTYVATAGWLYNKNFIESMLKR